MRDTLARVTELKPEATELVRRRESPFRHGCEGLEHRIAAANFSATMSRGGVFFCLWVTQSFVLLIV